MKKKSKNLYEGMYILTATLSEDARKKALDKITQSITEKSGEIHKIHDQGKRRMAYEIRGKREGYYYLIYFSADPSCISEVLSEYNLHEDLIRFMILQTNEVKEKLEFKQLKSES